VVRLRWVNLLGYHVLDRDVGGLVQV